MNSFPELQHPHARLLNETVPIEYFIKEVLKYPVKDATELHKITTLIRTAEADLSNFKKTSQTLAFENERHPNYRSNASRLELRKLIVKELLEKKRLENDDKLSLGKGGALPMTEVRYLSQAYLLIGLPASGKSQIANLIADKYGAIIVDSDFVKRKLPEYRSPSGATLVHSESSAIIFGDTAVDMGDFEPLIDNCLKRKANIVIPKVGQDYKSIIDFTKNLKERNYQVHLTLICLDKVHATSRALTRLIKSRRYVPLSLIFDGFGNEPILTFYKLFSGLHCDKDLFCSYGKISTAVQIGQNPKVIYADEDNPASIFKE